MKHIISALIFLFLISCANNTEKKLERALSLSGKNRVELEKVLKRYSTSSTDSLKYKAARFLIENMPGYYFSEGANLDNYSIYYKWLDDERKAPQQLLDSLERLYGDFKPSKLSLKYDIEVVDSAYLCEHIDLSFRTWQERPWCKNVSFENFCEYILPYRIGNERLTNWCKKYSDLYGPLLDSLKTEDPIVVANFLRDRILKEKGTPRFTMIRPNSYPDLDAFTTEYFNGSCDDIAQFTLFLFRSAGVACAIDYIPIRGNDNVGHSWVSLKNHKGEFFLMDFFGNIDYLSEFNGNRTAAKVKVFRKTFSKNIEALSQIQKITSSIPEEFSEDNYRFIDVTSMYTNYLTYLKIENKLLYPDKTNFDIAYLCMPSWSDWIPVDWSIKKNGQFCFEIESGNIMRLASYENGKLNFICDPFTVNKQTSDVFFHTQHQQKESITLFYKYSIDGDWIYRNRMVGGVFEGSNNQQFNKADTLFVIKNVPSRLFTHAPVLSPKKYQYVRYKGPSNSHCNVAEVQFYSDKTLLTGKIIGTPGCWQNDGSHEYTNAFDGETNTSFDHNTPDDGWTGIDLGTPQKITKIIYTPRNSANYIKNGQQYELFVSSKNGWESLGVQIPKADSLHYDNVPMGGLYYLKNYSEGKQERIFEIKDYAPIFR